MRENGKQWSMKFGSRDSRRPTCSATPGLRHAYGQMTTKQRGAEIGMVVGEGEPWGVRRGAQDLRAGCVIQARASVRSWGAGWEEARIVRWTMQLWVHERS